VRIGVISDTHGLLRPEAVAALRGSDLILHAGDIGAPAILDELAALAPLAAVRGNNDEAAWARSLPETAEVAVEGLRIYLLHDINRLALDPRASGYHVVVAGHSHRPRKERRRGVLYFNPGSAGPRRFRLPIALGRLWISREGIRAEVVTLAAGGAADGADA
jgi:putative phosphoesterase